MLLGPQLKSQFIQITSKSVSLYEFIIPPLTIYNVEKLWQSCYLNSPPCTILRVFVGLTLYFSENALNKEK